jgi:type I restriction enzyme S subunit
MNATLLLEHYARIGDAPDAIARLRRFILDLAMQGKLIEQSPDDARNRDVLRAARNRLMLKASKTGRLRWKPSEPVSDKEVKVPIPRNWIAARVNDTGLYINGLAFKPSEWQASGTPIIRIQNLTNSMKEFNYAIGVFPDEVVVRAGDILVSWSATLDAFIWQGVQGVLNQHIFRVIPDEGLTERRFLYLVLRKAIREMSEGEHAHGLAMMHINRGPFMAHVVLIPPLAEQHRILAKVDELMALCDQLEAAQAKCDSGRDRLAAASMARLNALDPRTFTSDARFALDNLGPLTTRTDQVKQLRQAILNLAVRGKLVKQDENDEPAIEFLKRLLVTTKNCREKNSKIKDIASIDPPFEAPKGWVWTRVQTTLDPNREISYGVIKLGDEPKAGGIPTLRCSDVRPGFIKLCGVRKVSEKIEANYKRTRLSGGEVVINIRGTLGGVALVPFSLNGFNVAREVAVVPIAADISGDFMVYLMLSPYFWARIQDNLRGIAYKGLNLGILRELAIPLPPVAEQRRIADKVGKLMMLCDHLEGSLATGERTRSKLLEAVLHRALEPA